MRRGAVLALIGMLGVVPVWGQAAGQTSDSETLQAILVEMRGIHNDMRLSETTQILLAELEIEQTAVNRAMQKRDDVKNRTTQVQTTEKFLTDQLARTDDQLNASIDPEQKRQLTQAEDQVKIQLANFKTQEQQNANDLADAERALQKEQDTMAGIQDQLDEVVRKMQPAAK